MLLVAVFMSKIVMNSVFTFHFKQIDLAMLFALFMGILS